MFSLFFKSISHYFGSLFYLFCYWLLLGTVCFSTGQKFFNWILHLSYHISMSNFPSSSCYMQPKLVCLKCKIIGSFNIHIFTFLLHYTMLHLNNYHVALCCMNCAFRVAIFQQSDGRTIVHVRS